MFNQNTDTEDQPTKFMGFYRGEVISTADPKQNGRVQIRVYPMFAGVDPEDLPWALYADTGMGGTRDVGSIRVPEIGSHVFVFFENGDHRHPVYFAGAPAIEDNIPDTPKLAREDDGTHAAANAAKKTGAKLPGGGTWDEPYSSYNPTYPKNHVVKTKNGIVVEVDDTDGAVRLHVYHPSGTRHEVDNAGNETDHISGNKVTVVIGNENHSVDGTLNVSVVGNVNIKADGNVTVEATEAKVTATTAKVESENVQLDSNGTLGGIVTTNHVCAFTGAPHPQGSLTCKAGG